MQRLNRLIVALIFAGVLASSSPTFSEQHSLRQQLIGTWTFVVTAVHRKDGMKTDVFGPSPNGVLMFQPDGHFVLINTRPGRPKYASGNRVQGTPEEFRDTVLGSIAYFGTYTTDEAKQEFILKIRGSTFPDYEGTQQVRPFSIVGDELRSVNPNPSQGGSPLDLVLKRVQNVE